AELTACDGHVHHALPRERRGRCALAEMRGADDVLPQHLAGCGVECDESRVAGAAEQTAVEVREAAVRWRGALFFGCVRVLPANCTGCGVERNGIAAGVRVDDAVHDEE